MKRLTITAFCLIPQIIKEKSAAEKKLDVAQAKKVSITEKASEKKSPAVKNQLAKITDSISSNINLTIYIK